jgi:hypothetical protein
VVDVEDYSLSFVVCSHMVIGKQDDAVTGTFHHLKTLSPALMAIYDAEKKKILKAMPLAPHWACDLDDPVPQAYAWV